MRRSVPFRVLALVLALLGSLAAPALATAHGVAHDHVARAHHEGADHHDDAALAFDGPSSDEHPHDHASVDSASGPRDVGRLHLTALGSPPVPTSVPEPAPLRVIRSASLSVPALLARPGPDGGPPPRLRAPPAR